MEKVEAKNKNGVSNSFWRDMKPLVMMQLKDKIDVSFLKSVRKTIFKIIYTILFFAALTIGIYFVFKLVIVLGLFSFLQTLNFRVYLVLMSVLFFLSFLSCLINITRTLYFSNDNQVLLTMPVSTSRLFASKMIVCFIYELLKNSTYILPFFLAYGLVMSLPLSFYLWSILSLLFLTILVVCLSGLLSIPAMGVAIIFRRNRTFEFLVLTLVIAALVYGVVKAINLIPTDIDIVRDWGKIYWSMQDFLKVFATNALLIDYLLQLLTGMSYGAIQFSPFAGKNLITLGVCVGVVVVSFLIIVLLSKRLFLKMASNPFEYRKKVIKRDRRNIKRRPFASASTRQTQILFRTSNLIYSVLATAILAPIAILLQNRVIGAMDTRLLGKFMGVSFNVLIILLMSLSSSVVISSTFSKDGNSAYLNKVNPVNYSIPLSAKLVLNAALTILSIIASCLIINFTTGIGIVATIFLSLALVLIYLAHLLWSAELDIMNPQNRLYQTTGSSSRNPNEVKSSIIAFVFAAVFAFVTYFLITEDIKIVFVKLFFISLATFLVRLYFYFTRIKLYYKEK